MRGQIHAVPLSQLAEVRNRLFHAHRYLIACFSLTALLLQSGLGYGHAHAYAQAQNPVDVENHKLAERVIAAGSQARGIIPLLELWENWDSSTPQKLQAELARLAVHPAVPAARKDGSLKDGSFIATAVSS